MLHNELIWTTYSVLIHDTNKGIKRKDNERAVLSTLTLLDEFNRCPL